MSEHQGPDELHRKRMKRREINPMLRFLTFSCWERYQLLGNARIRDAFAVHLEETKAAFGIRLIAWVFMPEHVHLLAYPTAGPSVVQFLFALKRPFARDVIARWRELKAPVLGRILDAKGKPHFWLPGGGHDRNVATFEERQEKIAYIHKNPVTRGLVENREDWKWSSYRWYMGDRSGVVSLDL